MTVAAAALRPWVTAMAPTLPPPVSLAGARLVRLGSNEWPGGPVAAAREAIVAAAVDGNRYPSSGPLLRERLAELNGVHPDQVVLGNGADELIRLCAQCVLEPGARGVLAWPSFPSYGDSIVACGGEPIRVCQSGGAAPDVDALARAAADGGARIVFLANPNNPTGTGLADAELRRLLGAVPGGCLSVVDEAYIDFTGRASTAVQAVRDGHPALCVLRTFSKLHGLAGVRVGYAVASPAVAAALAGLRLVHNVSSLAIAAALAALDAHAELAERVAVAASGRARLGGIFAAAGLRPLPSQANFVLAHVAGSGAAVAADLLRLGVAVRPLGGFGAADAIRASVGSGEDLDALERALGRLAPAAWAA